MRKFFLAGVALTCLAAAPIAAETPATFPTPYDAMAGMMSALETKDRDAVLAVFGIDNKDLISNPDPTEEAKNRDAILALYHQGYRMMPQSDGAVVIALGADSWPFPVPLVHTDTGWTFDAEAGRQEIADRVIGLNEIEVIDLLQAYVDLQTVFRLTDHDGDGVMEFAAQIISEADTRDGLFWPGDDSPVGELLARASEGGFSDGDQDRPPEPFKGYYFRILTNQSAAAPGGAMDYLVNGNMVAGHAILAVPAAYGETGVNSFMVSENGMVLETILGDETLKTAAAMTSYDPGPDWAPVEIPGE